MLPAWPPPFAAIQAAFVIVVTLVLGTALIGWMVRRERRLRVQRQLAEARAWRLLTEFLNPVQREQLQALRFLDVQSRLFPGRYYRVPLGRGLVRVFADSHCLGSLCIQPVHWLPEADVLLMHKVMLEGAEEHYLRTAHVLEPPGGAGAIRLSCRALTSDDHGWRQWSAWFMV